MERKKRAGKPFPGDTMYSGTPDNAGPVVSGDVVERRIDRQRNLSVKIA